MPEEKILRTLFSVFPDFLGCLSRDVWVETNADLIKFQARGQDLFFCLCL